MKAHATNIDSLSPAQRTLLGLMGNVLFHQDYSPPADTDWDSVIQESYRQTVFPTIASHSHEWPSAEAVSSRVKPALRRMLMRNMVVHSVHTDVHRLMRAADISYVIIKGAVSASYYAEAHLRSMGDVDLLVERGDFDRARQELLGNGFKPASENNGLLEDEGEHHAVLIHKGCKVELHYEIPGIPGGPVGERIRAIQAEIIPEARLTETELGSFMAPSPFHHGLIMLLHVQGHLLNEGIGLRHLCDWAVFADHFDNDDFIALFRERLESVGLWTFARCLSLASVHYMGLPAREWMGDGMDDRLVSVALLQDFLAGGNFGAKDADRERVYESKLISSSVEGDVSHGRLRNGLGSVNRWVKEKWPAARKCPLLLPFGWIYFVLRRAVLVLTGRKKRIRMNATLQRSRERQKLYRMLKLFETK